MNFEINTITFIIFLHYHIIRNGGGIKIVLGIITHDLQMTKLAKTLQFSQLNLLTIDYPTYRENIIIGSY
ncbi:MAG: hypothetical protein HRU07_05595 [Nitrosopumilus sp.]|nr:hypothetical protein [Nitrosopumilus sp.]NRA05619.1 hypothetical protein [Nitrosopumilus sp.]